MFYPCQLRFLCGLVTLDDYKFILIQLRNDSFPLFIHLIYGFHRNPLFLKILKVFFRCIDTDSSTILCVMSKYLLGQEILSLNSYNLCFDAQ